MFLQMNIEYGYVRNVGTYLLMRKLEKMNRRDGDTPVNHIRAGKGKGVKAILSLIDQNCLIILSIAS